MSDKSSDRESAHQRLRKKLANQRRNRGGDNPMTQPGHRSADNVTSAVEKMMLNTADVNMLNTMQQILQTPNGIAEFTRTAKKTMSNMADVRTSDKSDKAPPVEKCTDTESDDAEEGLPPQAV